MEGNCIARQPAGAGSHGGAGAQDPASYKGLIQANLSATDGSFVFSDVLPGNYTLLAIRDGASVEWTDINVLQRLIAQAKPVQVQPGDKSKVTIKLQ